MRPLPCLAHPFRLDFGWKTKLTRQGPQKYGKCTDRLYNTNAPTISLPGTIGRRKKAHFLKWYRKPKTTDRTPVKFVVHCVWNVMAHAQKLAFVFRRNWRVHLNQRGRQFSRLLAAEVCASAVVMLDTPRSEVVWRVVATHSIRQFSPSLPHPCVTVCHQVSIGLYRESYFIWTEICCKRLRVALVPLLQYGGKLCRNKRSYPYL